MKFILIIRENIYAQRTSEELMEIIRLHKSWYVQLAEKGYAIDGNGISEKGNLLEMIDGKVHVQPIRDVEEGIGGYYIIEAKDLEEAIEVAKGCPTYDKGDKIEVRQIM